jgi:hypothetical protein
MRVKQFHHQNQFIIEDDERNTFLQSYDSIIVKIDSKGKVFLGKNWNYSTTTNKHRCLFLGESGKETQAKLDSGEYTLDSRL